MAMWMNWTQKIEIKPNCIKIYDIPQDWDKTYKKTFWCFYQTIIMHNYMLYNNGKTWRSEHKKYKSNQIQSSYEKLDFACFIEQQGCEIFNDCMILLICFSHWMLCYVDKKNWLMNFNNWRPLENVDIDNFVRFLTIVLEIVESGVLENVEQQFLVLMIGNFQSRINVFSWKSKVFYDECEILDE